jgi:plastocyanin
MLVLVASVVGLAAVAVAGAATVTVNIARDGFRPATVTIQAGDTVTWRNRDTVPHQVVAENGAFASPVLAPGRAYSFVFRAAGTYRYRDALEPAERGRVVVRGAPPSISVALSAPIVRFGDQVHVRGQVSNTRAGQPVTILAQPFGQASYAQLAVVTTTQGGFFDLLARPTVLTNVQAVWNATSSQPVTAQVRPRLTLLPGRRGWLRTQATAARSFAGRAVLLQVRTRFGQWVTVRKLVLGRQSGRVFRVRPARRTTYRVFMTVNQAGPGYLESWSGTQTLRAVR